MFNTVLSIFLPRSHSLYFFVLCSFSFSVAFSSLHLLFFSFIHFNSFLTSLSLSFIPPFLSLFHTSSISVYYLLFLFAFSSFFVSFLFFIPFPALFPPTFHHSICLLSIFIHAPFIPLYLNLFCSFRFPLDYF